MRRFLPVAIAAALVPAVNAFALPGGHVYVTRGILAHLESEAELAGVLGPEIGHVTARHSARAYTRSATASIGVAITSIFVPKARPFMGAVQAGLSLALLKYDRDQELQSDHLGAGYVAKVGWALVNGESTQLNSGLAAYHGIYDGQVFLLAGLASQAMFRQAQPYFVDTIKSFAPASEAEMGHVTPHRLGFATVRSGDTWQSIAERGGGVIPASDLAVVNGFAPNSQPPVGKQIKIVTSGD